MRWRRKNQGDARETEEEQKRREGRKEGRKGGRKEGREGGKKRGEKVLIEEGSKSRKSVVECRRECTDD